MLLFQLPRKEVLGNIVYKIPKSRGVVMIQLVKCLSCGYEFDPQNIYKELPMVVCNCIASSRESETRVTLWLSSQLP
jgi:predicted Zn-ribbon and HTH transcriptional regulator